MPRLSWFCVLLAIPLTSAVCTNVGKTQEQAPYSIGWAWSTKEVETARDAFWPQFRGPTGDGHANPSANPPIQWSETENVRWRTEIPGKAWSSPVAWGDTIWVTTASENGLSMSAIALDRKSGAIRWNLWCSRNWIG